MPTNSGTQNAAQSSNSSMQGLNLFALQLGTQSILQNSEKRINGIPTHSRMYTTREQYDSLSTNSAFVNGAVNTNNLGTIYANSIVGGSIVGVNLKIGTDFNVDSGGNVTANNFKFNGGTIGGWQVSSTSIISPNGNLVLDSANNRILLYNAGVPQVVIQG